MPYTNKTGHFLIKTDDAKNPASFNNFADRQALYNYWDQKPYRDVTDTLRRKRIYEEEMYEYAAPFSDWLKETGRRISSDREKLRYSKTSKQPVHYRVLRTVTGTPGLRNENFNVTFTTDGFKPGDSIAPEEGFQFGAIVQSLPRINGDGWEYTLRNADPSGKHFPIAYLRENTRWVKRGGSKVSEASDQWGSSLWNKGRAVLTWEVGLSHVAKELHITDEALRHVFTLDPCTKNKDGSVKPVENMPKTFLSEAELNTKMEIAKEMEEDLLWAQYNPNIPDTSTRLHRQIGAGVFDFYKDGNIYDYTPTFENSSIREFTDFTESLWFNNIGDIVFGTGKPGMDLASRWIKREFGELNVIRDYDHYIEKSGTAFPGGPEAWKLKKPTFNAYELDGGGVVRFELWPWLDDRSRRGKLHPKTQKPLLGYHFIAMRYRGNAQNSNIVLVDRPDIEQWGYEPGATGLYGLTGGGKNVHTSGRRVATLRYENGYGLMVEDVNDFIWFRPNIQ